MKFNFDRNTMINEILIAQEVISTKSALSILSNVLFIAKDNRLIIKATDIKINFETKIPIEIEEEGAITVFCDKLIGILSSLPEGEIQFDLQKKDNLTIAVIKHLTRKIKFQLKCMSEDKFPEFPDTKEISFFDIPSKDLKTMITQTYFAVSNEEARFFMNGVYFEKKNENFILVATDGRRLSFASKKFEEPLSDFPSAIVHPKVLNIVAKHAPDEGNIAIAIIDKTIFFRFLNYELSSALLEGQFPNYERVIPEKQLYNFQVQKNDLIDALKRTSIMLDKKSERLFFKISPGILSVTSQETDLGDANEEIPCQYNGEETTIAMNYRYVEEPLKVINSNDVIFEFTGTMKAVTLRSEHKEDNFHIIMPMQMT